MSPAISRREYQASDRSFLFSSFLKNQRNQYPQRWLSNEAYFSKYEKILENYLANCRITMAVDSQDPDNLVGYCIYEGQTLHYVYVKYLFRRLGVAKDMLLGSLDFSKPVRCTCWSEAVQLIASRHPNLIYIGVA